MHDIAFIQLLTKCLQAKYPSLKQKKEGSGMAEQIELLLRQVVHSSNMLAALQMQDVEGDAFHDLIVCISRTSKLQIPTTL
jgi:hypothetical protein